MKQIKRALSVLLISMLLFSSSILNVYADDLSVITIKNFKDVKESDWFYETLSNIVGKGIISGYPDGTFKAQNNITKAEFAKILLNSLDMYISEGYSFQDVEDHWAKNIIYTAWEKGIIRKADFSAEEYDNKANYHPDEEITRIEMSRMAVRALGLDVDAKAKAGEKTEFKDDRYIKNADKGYVILANNYGIVKGYTDETFRPNGLATRAEASQMLFNLLNAETGKIEENVVERVNETLQKRDFTVKLPIGIESVAVNENPQTYEELIENIESLKVYSYTTRKSNDWELIALSQFVSNPNEEQVTVNIIGAIRMELPKYKLEVVDFNFEGTIYNCIYSDELASDGFTSGVLIKDGEILERISHVKDHYIVGLKDKGNIYKADYIAFTKYVDDFFTSSCKYDSVMRKMLIVFENPFK